MTGEVKVWSGSAWAYKPVKVWTGSAWVTKPLKRWDGSAWITTNPAVGGSPPVLESHQDIFPADNSSLSIVSTAITVNNGDLLVVKTSSWGASPVPSLPTALGQTFTERGTISSGSFCYVKIHTAIVTGSPGTLVVTQPFSGSNGRRSSVFERWSNAKLAATPAINATKNSTSANGFSASVTTTAANSVVTWTAGDYNGVLTGTPAYRSSAVNESYNRVSSYAFYNAYQAAATAGAQTFGLTTPAASVVWSYLAMEVQAL